MDYLGDQVSLDLLAGLASQVVLDHLVSLEKKVKQVGMESQDQMV